MPTVLLTAFEPYGAWPVNASALALNELMRDIPLSPQISMRLLPVDFDMVKAWLADELTADYDYVLHVGQAPGSAAVQVEAVGLNIACDRDAGIDRQLCEGGPLAYRSSLPLFEWVERIRTAGIPAKVSFHAGTYLCNAALYLTHYYSQRLQLKTRAAFLHVPLDPVQVLSATEEAPCLPASLSASAIRIVLESLD